MLMDEEEGAPVTRVGPMCASSMVSRPKSKELSASRVIGDTSASTSEVVGKVTVALDIDGIVLIDDASDNEVICDVWLAEVINDMLVKVIDVIWLAEPLDVIWFDEFQPEVPACRGWKWGRTCVEMVEPDTWLVADGGRWKPVSELSSLTNCGLDPGAELDGEIMRHWVAWAWRMNSSWFFCCISISTCLCRSALSVSKVSVS